MAKGTEEIWVIWVGDGAVLYEPELQGHARRSSGSAKAWCNENRKLEQGDPINWQDPDPEGQIVGRTMVTLQGVRTSWKEQRTYVLQPVKLED